MHDGYGRHIPDRISQPVSRSRRRAGAIKEKDYDAYASRTARSSKRVVVSNEGEVGRCNEVLEVGRGSATAKGVISNNDRDGKAVI